MNRQQLRDLQTPLKNLYQAEPTQAIAVMHAQGTVDIGNLSCQLQRCPGSDSTIIAGLHPKAGGDGSMACSGDMLLQSLVACAGVTLAAVATSMEIPVQQAEILAEGTMDFRGTLGVSRDVPVGMTSIQLTFVLSSTAPAEQLQKLVQLTERYCVVMQTLAHNIPIKTILTQA